MASHKIPYDRIVNVKEEKKSLYRTDILIDDYLGNIIEFLGKTDGWAILIDQPWNREREALKDFVSEGRLHIASDLEESLQLIKDHRTR